MSRPPRIYLLGKFNEKCCPVFLKAEEKWAIKNLGINSKKFQYFHNKSIISFQIHYKSLFVSNCIILYDFQKKKSEKVPFW